MPTSPNARYITVRVGLVPKLTERWEHDLTKLPNVNKDFGGYVNDLLDALLKKEEYMQLYAPKLELEGHSGNALFIMDHKLNKRVEVYLYDRRLKCAEHDSFDCEHVHFALGLPELGRLNLKKP